MNGLATLFFSIAPLGGGGQRQVVAHYGPPVVSIASTSATEGPAGSAAFTVSLSWPSSVTVSATYTTAGGTATSGLDFTAGTGSVSFAPGVTSQVVNVPVVNDALDEDDEAFTVTLSAPVNALARHRDRHRDNRRRRRAPGAVGRPASRSRKATAARPTPCSR